MKKSSAVIQISSNTLTKDLNQIMEDLIELVEEDLWISVEDCYEENSFWIPIPPEDDWDPVGIIEIDVNDDPFNRILSLVHEVGHYLLEQDEDFPEDNHIVFTESLAWYLGYKYFKALGFEIDREEYMAEASRSLDAYARRINEKNNN